MEKLLHRRFASATVACLLTLGLAAACSPSVTSPSPSDKSMPVNVGSSGSPNATELDTAPYGNCPTDPDRACKNFHGPDAVAIAACVYEDCFEMSYGEKLRVVAADELGYFPKQWFVWHDNELTSGECVLTKSGNKTRVEIPDDAIRCRADMDTGEHLYHEHFGSNPATGCLVWLECRAY